MRDTNEALDVLKSLSGLGALAWDSDGQVELVFQKTTRVAVARIDEGNLELLTELPKLGTNLSADKLLRLLTANYLGEAVGRGRIAADPRDNILSYGLRLDVTTIPASALEGVFIEFLRYAEFWNSPDAGDVLAGGTATPVLAGSDMMFRA